MVAGCDKIILATPPRPDGTVTPEIVYIADKIGAESIVLAGGAQAVAAMAYGTEDVSKVDKILGPGNQGRQRFLLLQIRPPTPRSLLRISFPRLSTALTAKSSSLRST